MGLKVISKGKLFYENFATRGILRRFLNPWYFTEVLKPMIFNRGSERLFLKFKKTLGNTFPRDDLAEENATLSK